MPGSREAVANCDDQSTSASGGGPRRRTLVLAGVLVLALLPWGRAQGQDREPVWAEAFTGSAVEEYLRMLQIAGIAGSEPWSIRPLGPTQLARLSPGPAEHPWSARFIFSAAPRTAFEVVRPISEIRFNSAFPAGSNDGPTWAGRGFTGTVSGGIAARMGPVSLRLVPTLFRAQNSAFTLQPNGRTGYLRYADGRFPDAIDRPQAFGDKGYGRFDLGESTLRIDARRFTIGASTASQWWGPAAVYPILLGNNAGGFPHLFLGTARPLLLRIIRVHGRVDWGVLSQSSFSPVTGETYYESVERPGTRRFMGGAVIVLQPTFLPGLEVGAARFIHEGWPRGGLTSRHFGVPFQTLYKKDLVQDSTDSLIASGQNQLLSVFARWAVYQAGMEFYAERGKDDHNWDRRDLIVETEHSASTTFGFAKVWPRAGQLTALRAEVINYASPANAALRHEPGFYPHSVVRQGHTHRGQLLGASIGAGSGAGARVSLERYTRDGKYAVSIAREQLDRRVDAPDTTVESQVKTMLQLETIRFTRLGDITAKVGLTNAIHWNFGDDRTNWSFMLGTRVGVR